MKNINTFIGIGLGCFMAGGIIRPFDINFGFEHLSRSTQAHEEFCKKPDVQSMIKALRHKPDGTIKEFLQGEGTLRLTKRPTDKVEMTLKDRSGKEDITITCGILPGDSSLTESEGFIKYEI
jgi:hypothetical protein